MLYVGTDYLGSGLYTDDYPVSVEPTPSIDSIYVGTDYVGNGLHISTFSTVTINSHVATGGIVLGGSAITTYTPVVITTPTEDDNIYVGTDYSESGLHLVDFTNAVLVTNDHIASGGVIVGGSAITTYTPATPATQDDNIYVGDAYNDLGIHLDDFTLTAVVSNHVATGGVVVGGSALTTYTPAVVVAPTEDNLYIGTDYSDQGLHLVDFTSAVTTTNTHVASGGVVIGGTAITTKTKAHISTGGVVVGGSAITTYTKAIQSHIATGGVVVGGSAVTTYTAVKPIPNHVATGGLVLGGSAVTTTLRVHVASGGLVVGGSAVTRYIPATDEVFPNTSINVRRRYISVFDTTNLVFHRYSQSYIDDDCKVITPRSINVNALGDLQPYKPKSLQQRDAPSGFTLIGGYRFSTKVVLNTLEEVSSTRSDTVEIDGRVYYVWRNQNWGTGPLATDEYNNYTLIQKRIPNAGAP